MTELYIELEYLLKIVKMCNVCGHAFEFFRFAYAESNDWNLFRCNVIPLHNYGL